MTDLSARTTHNLWVDARQFTIELTRPTDTTIKLTVTKPVDLDVTDGAVVLVSTKPINATNYPQDGTQYSASTDWAQPASVISNAHVVAAFYGILNEPFPPSEIDSDSVEQFSITVTNTEPNQIYYASVHAASNVLQYYPIGVQSYPLDSNNIEKSGASWTGSIPSLASAPTSPTPGMVYYDQQLNLVQYWTGTTWIPTRADSILTGAYNPGVLGQTYLLSSGMLMVFNGTKWVEANASNFQVRSGTSWIPFTGVSANIALPETGQPGQFIYDYTLQRIQYFGTAWTFPDSTNTLFNAGSGLVPAFIGQFSVEPVALSAPYLGQLFYNTTSKVLNAWNGTAWVQANTDQQGTPISSKIAIGTDGSYGERLALIKVLQAMLGWPQMCVELTEDQYNFAIDNALDNYRQFSPGAYTNKFITFKLIPDQQLYYLNSAVNKTDKIVDVYKIHRVGAIGAPGIGGPGDLWYQSFAQQFYSATGGGGDILSTQLLQSLGSEWERIFAGNLTFNWDESSRELFIQRRVAGYETVLIECTMERTEQEIMGDRWAKQFIQDWSVAWLKMALGMIRSKYSSGTPGASGNITLNGELLIAEARQDMTELKQGLLDYEYGGFIGGGNNSFLFG